jgi:hypothetical protein
MKVGHAAIAMTYGEINCKKLGYHVRLILG